MYKKLASSAPICSMMKVSSTYFKDLIGQFGDIDPLSYPHLLTHFWCPVGLLKLDANSVPTRLRSISRRLSVSVRLQTAGTERSEQCNVPAWCVK